MIGSVCAFRYVEPSARFAEERTDANVVNVHDLNPSRALAVSIITRLSHVCVPFETTPNSVLLSAKSLAGMLASKICVRSLRAKV